MNAKGDENLGPAKVAPGGKDWNLVWLAEYRKFLGITGSVPIDGSRERVVGFLKSLVKRNKSAWVRLQAFRVIRDRLVSQGDDIGALHDIESGLKKRAAVEQRKNVFDEATPGEPGIIDPNEPWVIQQLRTAIRVKHLAIATEQAYTQWVTRFAAKFGVESEADWNAVVGAQVENFLTELAVDGRVAASTQNQAFSALLFVFEHVLDKRLRIANVMRTGVAKVTSPLDRLQAAGGAVKPR